MNPIFLKRLSGAGLLGLLLSACGGGGGGGGGAPGNNGGGNSIPNGSLPALALETCPASPDTSGAPVAATITVQTAQGFDGSQGHVHVAANGVRTGRESPLKSAVNCISWQGQIGNRALNLGAYLFDYVLGSAVGSPRHVATDDAEGHPGFGYVVSHNNQNGNSPLGSFMNPLTMETVVFAGANHAIHRITMNYRRNVEAGGQNVSIPLVIEWLVAAGRNEPVWAVNWRMDQVINPSNVNFNAYRMDARGPYGSIGWDGKKKSDGSHRAVGQIYWGFAGYQFKSHASTLNVDSNWDYQTPTPLNYVLAREAVAGSNLQFGIIQTRRDDWMGNPDGIYNLRNKSYIDGKACIPNMMPCDWAWPYQMMQFGLGTQPTTNKLMAWGSQYGYLGATNLPNFDYSQTQNASGERAYATFINWGGWGSDGDARNLADIGSAYSTLTIQNAVGQVAADATNPGSNVPKTLPANGYNHIYGSYELRANPAGQVDAVLGVDVAAPAAGIRNPVFRIGHYETGTPVVKVNGIAKTSGSDYFVSYDTASKTLWLTLLAQVPANSQLRLQIN